MPSVLHRTQKSSIPAQGLDWIWFYRYSREQARIGHIGCFQKAIANLPGPAVFTLVSVVPSAWKFGSRV